MVEESHAPAQLWRTSSEPLRRRSFSSGDGPARYSGNEWQPRAANQVEPWNTFCIPPLIFQGWVLHTRPQSKGGRYHVRRKPVHL